LVNAKRTLGTLEGHFVLYVVYIRPRCP